MTSPTPGLIEVITVMLADGASLEEFLVVNEAMKQNYVSQQPGFLSRETAVSDSGEIRIAVHWETKADSDNSIAGFGEAPGVGEFMAPLNGDTMVVTQYMLRGGSDRVDFPGSSATETIVVSLASWQPLLFVSTNTAPPMLSHGGVIPASI